MDNLCEVDHSNSPDALTYGHMDNLCEVDHMPTLPLALLLIIFPPEYRNLPPSAGWWK